MSPLRRRALVRACLLFAGVTGCGQAPVAPGKVATKGSEPPPEQAISTAPPPEIESPPVKGPVITAVAMPDELLLDGDLSEWGFPDGWEQERSYHVQVAFGTSQVAISAILRGWAKERGVWFGVRFPASDFPAPEKLTIDGVRDGFPCDGEPWPPGLTVSEFRQLCDRAKASHEQSAREHRQKFERAYFLDAKGIRGVGSDDHGPIEGASFATKDLDDRIAIEGTIPLAALPRTSTAVIDTVELFALAATTSALPPSEHRRWTPLDLPVAIPPSVHPRLIAYLVDYGVAEPGRPSIVSWAPGDPMDVEFEVVDEYRSVRWTEHAPLFTGGLHLGAITIVKPAMGGLVTLVDDDYVDSTFARGQPDGVITEGENIHHDVLLPFGASKLHTVKRGQDLYLIEEHVANSMLPAGPRVQDGTWNVSVISPDGKVRREQPIELQPPGFLWFQLSFLHSADYSTLSLEGITDSDYYLDPPRPRTRVTWRFDPAQREYLFKGATRVGPGVHPPEKPSPEKPPSRKSTVKKDPPQKGKSK